MDTNIKNPKQGASKIADLLQQKPQEEVLQLKPSTASSDEEKLAAGISTIGLQAKRLSGARKRKLIKERKMREGTWTEKPDRKNPPPQDKGKAGSSGGVKRPHSDSIRLQTQYTIQRKAATQETQEHPGADWNI